MSDHARSRSAITEIRVRCSGPLSEVRLAAAPFGVGGGDLGQAVFSQESHAQVRGAVARGPRSMGACALKVGSTSQAWRPRGAFRTTAAQRSGSCACAAAFERPRPSRTAGASGGRRQARQPGWVRRTGGAAYPQQRGDEPRPSAPAVLDEVGQRGCRQAHTGAWPQRNGGHRRGGERIARVLAGARHQQVVRHSQADPARRCERSESAGADDDGGGAGQGTSCRRRSCTRRWRRGCPGRAGRCRPGLPAGSSSPCPGRS